jgi:hypothetical protein
MRSFGRASFPSPTYLPKQHKEEEDHARKFLETMKTLEALVQDHLKNYFFNKGKPASYDSILLRIHKPE